MLCCLIICGAALLYSTNKLPVHEIGIIVRTVVAEQADQSFVHTLRTILFSHHFLCVHETVLF